MRLNTIIQSSLLIACLLFPISCLEKEDTLYADFVSPPDNTKPGVYWYWINEHVSREGITKDLESLAHIGIGEVFIGNIFVEGLSGGNVRTLGDEWLELMQFAIKEGSRIGINVSTFNSPGWSQSGGPWIKPEQAMKYLVSSETIIEGGQSVKTHIDRPTESFEDVVLLAMPSYSVGERAGFHISSPVKIKNQDALYDNDRSTACTFDNKQDEPILLDIKFAKPQSIRSLTIYPSVQSFKIVCSLSYRTVSAPEFIQLKKLHFDRFDSRLSSGPVPHAPMVISLIDEPVTEFRLVIENAPSQFEMNEICFSSLQRLENYQEKLLNKVPSLSAPDWYAYTWKTQEQKGEEGVIPFDRIVDVSQYLMNDTLRWDAPEGDWKIVRIGMAPTGTTNTPAPPSSVGLEIDKMSQSSLQHHYDSYVGRILTGLSEKERKSFRRVIADSYEAGPQNWTNDFRAVFIETYGYDPLPWLSVLTGNIIESAEKSDRFLWDLRRLVADRIASEYVGGMKSMLERNGTELWLENYGWNGFASEFLKYGKYAPEIGGEFWTNHGKNTECRLAASACHIYGKNNVFAESYTTLGAPFVYHPFALKLKGDESYTEGVNQHIFHLAIHQPQEKAPGINAWFGIELNRLNTWFDQSKSWIDYQRRCCYMLQQGQASADVCFFIGEDTPKISGWVDESLSKGYDYDFINADVIENSLKVKDSRLILPSGASYALLVLPPLKTMRPSLLKRLKELIEQGANVSGHPLDKSPGLAGYPECDETVRRLTAEMWGTNDVNTSFPITKSIGAGKMFCNIPINDVLQRVNCQETVRLDKSLPVKWKQRILNDGEIFFLSNQSDSTVIFDADFRVEGYIPELWNAVDGSARYLSEYISKEGRTIIPLQLQARESGFIVFRNKSIPEHATATSNIPAIDIVSVLSNPWDVEFSNKSSDETFQIRLDSLTDWSQSSDPRVRFFSGSATYKTTLDIPEDTDLTNLYVQFEKIGVVATVSINGTLIESALWSVPYRTNISSYVKKGSNLLEIKVANLWRNKIIEQSTSTVLDSNFYMLYKPDIAAGESLSPSGIWGDVKVIAIKE